MHSFRCLSLLVSSLAVALASSCAGCGGTTACTDDAACDSGEVCVLGPDGGACAAPGSGGGKEGEGEDSLCGNGTTDVGELCDDGNSDEQDACTNACTATSARLEAVAGATPPGSLAITFPSAVVVAGGHLIVAAETGIMAAPVDATTGELSGPWLRVGRGLGTRDLTDPNRLLDAAPRDIAGDDAGNIYYVPSTRDRVLLLRPGSSIPETVLGGGSVATNVDPPSFVFADAPTNLRFEVVLRVAVSPDGAVVFALTGDAPGRRIVALDVATNEVRVFAGRYYGSETGNPAQMTSLVNISDIAVARTDAGPTGGDGLWIGSSLADVRYLSFADNTIVDVSGPVPCGAPPQQPCLRRAHRIEDDATGGYFALDFGEGGVYHASDVGGVMRVEFLGGTNTQREIFPPVDAVDAREVPFEVFEMAASGSHLFLTEHFANALLRLDAAKDPPPLVVLASSIQPLPERAIDRNLGVLNAVALSDDFAFVAARDVIWRVALADGTTTVVLRADDARPCVPFANPSRFVDALAVTDDGETLYFSQKHDDRVCIHSVGDQLTEVFLDSSRGIVFPTTLELVDDDSELWVLSDSQIKRVASVDGGELPPLVGHDLLVTGFAARSSCDFAIAIGLAIRANTCSGTNEFEMSATTLQVFVGSPHLGVTEGGSTLLMGEQGGALFELPDGIVLAGGQPGFADGTGADARFETDIKDIDVGDGMVAIASSTSIRLVRFSDNPSIPAQVTTLVGSDARTDDGRLLEARLLSPLSFSCSPTACVAAESELGTFRIVDLAGGRIDRVLGSDGAPATPAVSFAAMVDDDTFVWPDGDGAVTSFTLGAPTPVLVRSPAAFYDDVTALRVVDVEGASKPVLWTARGNGDVSLIGEDIVELATTTAPLISLAAGPRPSTPTEPWIGWGLDEVGTLYRFDLHAADLAVAVAADFVDATSIALDTSGNLVAAGFAGISQIDIDGDLLPVAEPRLLVASGDGLLPASCRLLLDRAGDDLLAADTCTGAVLRLVVSDAP